MITVLAGALLGVVLGVGIIYLGLMFGGDNLMPI